MAEIKSFTTHRRNKSNKQLIPISVLGTARNTWLRFDGPKVYISSESPKNTHLLFYLTHVQHDTSVKNDNCKHNLHGFIRPVEKFHLH